MSVRSVRTKNSPWRLCFSKVAVSWELIVFLGLKAARFMRDTGRVIQGHRTSDVEEETEVR